MHGLRKEGRADQCVPIGRPVAPAPKSDYERSNCNSYWSWILELRFYGSRHPGAGAGRTPGAL
jgi:hypothetical protein